MLSELVVSYLFLGGCGAGGCLVVAALSLLIAREDLRPALASRFASCAGALYRKFVSPILMASLGALALGSICLFADLGQPGRIFLLLFSGVVTHLTVGAWALVLCFLVGAFLVLVWQGVVPVTAMAFRIVNGLLAALSLVVALYTGLLLSSVAAVPVWHSGWLAVLFLVSAISCGIALMGGVSALSEGGRCFTRALRRLAKLDMVVIVVEAVVVALWLLLPAFSGETVSAQAGDASFAALTAGALAPLFWAGFCGLGLALPFVVEGASTFGLALPSRGGAPRATSAQQAESPAAMRIGLLVSAIAVLIGGYLLRYLVVASAVAPVSLLAPGLL